MIENDDEKGGITSSTESRIFTEILEQGGEYIDNRMVPAVARLLILFKAKIKIMSGSQCFTSHTAPQLSQSLSTNLINKSRSQMKTNKSMIAKNLLIVVHLGSRFACDTCL